MRRLNTSRVASAVLMLAMAVLFTGCQYQDGTVRSADYDGEDTDPFETWTTWTLWAGQNIDAGTVTVWGDHEHMFVKFQTTGDWYLTETQVAVATSLEGIPQKKGNPNPGQFPYGEIHDPPVQEYTYEIDQAAEWFNVELFVATHAVVKEIREGVVIQTQTGWAGDHEFEGKNWALYFHFVPRKVLHLPPRDLDIHMYPEYPGQNSYWDHTLSGIPSGYDITNIEYAAWCVSQFNYMNPGRWYNLQLWSSYDPDLPDDFDSPNWDLVNWVINNRVGYGWEEVQHVIWYFINGVPDDEYPLTVSEKVLRDAALEHEGFYPGPGQNIAIVCYSPDLTPYGDEVRTQLTFIEVDP